MHNERSENFEDNTEIKTAEELERYRGDFEKAFTKLYREKNPGKSVTLNVLGSRRCLCKDGYRDHNNRVGLHDKSRIIA